MSKKVAVNIIMGFLGVGKTSAILDLLKQKPKNEKWAVLVNEFGEVGIDGAIISALVDESENEITENKFLLSEVPGGCLCCVSGIPFHIALDRLLAEQQLDRVLIEPTGLGHPKNLIRSLVTEEYKTKVIPMASICLIDPRQLKDPRYQQHDTFNDQCYLADVLVANKTDLCQQNDQDNFDQYAAAIKPEKSALGWVKDGKLDASWLDLSSDVNRNCMGFKHRHEHVAAGEESKASNKNVSKAELISELGFQSFENSGMGYYSIGWLFEKDQVFNHQSLSQWLMGLSVERVKGLLITDKGNRVMNIRDQVFTELPTRELQQSRIEIIDNKAIDRDKIEYALLACRLASNK